MIICPVCKRKIRKGYICTECGHDECQNIENYLSLVKISGTVKTLYEESKAYQDKITEARLYALVGDRMSSYESQIRVMAEELSQQKIQISEQKTQISEQKTQLLEQKKQILEQNNQISEQKKRLDKLEESGKLLAADRAAEVKTSTAAVQSTAVKQSAAMGKAAEKSAVTGKTEIRKKEPWKVGKIVTFGEYMINKKNQKDPIEWMVLDHKNAHEYLLLSRYGLKVKNYTKKSWNDSWENELFHDWLNKNFYWDVFDRKERNEIGRIFLLSKEEAQSYFKNDGERKAEPTEYAKDQNVALKCSQDKYGRWWLRDLNPPSRALFVDANGHVNENGTAVWMDGIMVRPAMWVTHKD